jgi:hypothetical protein
MQVGDKVLYHEDGGAAVCELVKYERTNTDENATLKILEVQQQPFIGEYIVGEEFEVWHRVDMGGWGGDWRIEPQ